MNAKKRQEINKLATVVINTLELGFPIPVEDIPSKLGGTLNFEEVLTEEGEKIEAKISKEGNSFQIIINPNRSDRRRRFSIAHELGHLFIHMGYLINEDKWSSTNDYKDSVYYRKGYNSEEYEANEFAAALLMPEQKFKDIAKQYLKNGRYELEPIAEYFDVSIDAARNRGRWLRLFQWS